MTQIRGPSTGGFNLTVAAPKDRMWSPCGGEAQLQVLVQAKGSRPVEGPDAILEGHDIDASCTQIFDLEWASC